MSCPFYQQSRVEQSKNGLPEEATSKLDLQMQAVAQTEEAYGYLHPIPEEEE